VNITTKFVNGHYKKKKNIGSNVPFIQIYDNLEKYNITMSVILQSYNNKRHISISIIL